MAIPKTCEEYVLTRLTIAEDTNTALLTRITEKEMKISELLEVIENLTKGSSINVSTDGHYYISLSNAWSDYDPDRYVFLKNELHMVEPPIEKEDN